MAGTPRAMAPPSSNPNPNGLGGAGVPPPPQHGGRRSPHGASVAILGDRSGGLPASTFDRAAVAAALARDLSTPTEMLPTPAPLPPSALQMAPAPAPVPISIAPAPAVSMATMAAMATMAQHQAPAPLPSRGPEPLAPGSVPAPAVSVAAASAPPPSASDANTNGAHAMAMMAAAAATPPGTKKPRKKTPRNSLRQAHLAAEAEAKAAAALEATTLPAAPAVAAPTHYNRLDESDVAEARNLGLLVEAVHVSADAASSDYGIAYEKKGGSKVTGCGTDLFPSQKALQERCKQFAMERGFQLYVAGSSSRADGGGNVKYRCKKLHGQQFFDPNTPADQLQCPFYINGYGLGPAWKITRACFLHNHYKFIGARPGAHGSAPAGPTGAPTAPAGGEGSVEGEGSEGATTRVRQQRNTTLSTNVLCRMVNQELDKYPSAVAMSKLDGKLVRRILLGRGHTINHMMASRIKRQIQLSRIQSIRLSYQKLKSYFDVIVEKNPGSQYLFEVDEGGVFKRAVVVPSATLHAMQRSQKIISVDRVRPVVLKEGTDPKELELAEDESDDSISGVYIYASTKDHNDQVVVFAVGLVASENTESWAWFLITIQDAYARAFNRPLPLNEYTVVAGRANGLQPAIQTVWPQATHHYCVRRLVDEEIVGNKKLPLSDDKKQHIYDLARCESEAEFKQIRQELAQTNEAAMHYLDSLNRANWVKFAFLETFKKPTFGTLSSDLTSMDEITVSPMKHTKPTAPSSLPLLRQWFGDELPRSSQPLQFFNRYFMKIAENFHARRKDVEQRPPHELVPKRFAQLERNLQGSQRCESVPCSNGTYMVRSLAQISNVSVQDTWRHVNLMDWECTCLDWQDRSFPCVHGIHAAELNRRRIDSLYDAKGNSVEQYRATYEMGFIPWPLEAATMVVDKNLKIRLDELFSSDPNAKRKPGPRPKLKKLLHSL